MAGLVKRLRDISRNGPVCLKAQYEAHEAADRIEALEAEVAGYREWVEDVKRLTRQLDVEMHGEEGAAKQASLCDLIGAGTALKARLTAMTANAEALAKALAPMAFAKLTTREEHAAKEAALTDHAKLLEVVK